jgi:hypothetical protein
MSPLKLSLFGVGDDREETVELDDELVSKFRETVDSQPDLTLAEALRHGLQHVVDNPPAKGGTGLR